MKPLFKIIILFLLGVGIGGAALSWYLSDTERERTSFRTACVKRGDLLATISATGTVEPEELVDVGAQVAGQIISFGKDKHGNTVDYGSAVEEGTILARIDDSLYVADVALANARVQQARAGVRRAEADLVQLKAKLFQATRDWERAKSLGPSEALAEASYDAYQTAYETAQANVALGEAVIEQAKSAVAEAQATLERARRNLGYCIISSPVKGVVIDRRVNIGQTVVASLNAPSLFLIAKDLTRMQVWVSVNEADIGSIRPGQAATFTVDAYPGEVFRAEVRKIRLNATMTQNVVTYTVEVTTDNSGKRLLPYLTANVEFELGRRHNVLLVPNAALRWSPRLEQVAPKFREEAKAAFAVGRNGEGERPGSEAAAQSGQRGRSAYLWTQEGRFLRPIAVRADLSDGTLTEVEGHELKEGLAVVVGEQPQAANDENGTNPFTPQMMKGTRPPER